MPARNNRWVGPMIGLALCVLGIAAVIHWAPELSKLVEGETAPDKITVSPPTSLVVSAKEFEDANNAWKEQYDAQIKESAIRQAQRFFLHERPEKPGWAVALYGEDVNPFSRICTDLEWLYAVQGVLTYFYPQGIIPITWEEAGISQEATEQKMRAAGIALTKALVGALAPDQREARKNAKPCNEGRESEWSFANAEEVMERATEVWDLTNTTPDDSGILVADLRQILLADFKADMREFCEREENNIKPACLHPPVLVERVSVFKNRWNFSDKELGIMTPPQTKEESGLKKTQTKVAH